jgi:hypothetical protein
MVVLPTIFFVFQYFKPADGSASATITNSPGAVINQAPKLSSGSAHENTKTTGIEAYGAEMDIHDVGVSGFDDGVHLHGAKSKLTKAQIKGRAVAAPEPAP